MKLCLYLKGDVVHVTMLCFDFIPSWRKERGLLVITWIGLESCCIHCRGSAAMLLLLLLLFRENTSIVHPVFICSALSCGVCSLLNLLLSLFSLLINQGRSFIKCRRFSFFLFLKKKKLNPLQFFSHNWSKANPAGFSSLFVVVSSTLRRHVCPQW